MTEIKCILPMSSVQNMFLTNTLLYSMVQHVKYIVSEGRNSERKLSEKEKEKKPIKMTTHEYKI
jgi:hypothetical protein